MGLDHGLRKRVVEPAYEDIIDWRKQNAIRGWFVENCDINDNGVTEITASSLRDLRDQCAELLKHKDKPGVEDIIQDNSLCPTEGFFFGSNEIDKWFWMGIKDTLEALNKLDLEDNDERYEYWEWY